MTRQGELEAAAQAGPVDADGDRLREARHALQQLLTVRDEALGFGGARERDELLDVGARDEVVRLAREERHGPHRALALERFERREEVGFQRARDLVDRFALHVERDDRDPVGQLPAECGSRHQRRSRTMAKPMPPCAQIDSRPNCASRRAISLASVVTMRPPVAPNGWPMAIEPPITLIRSSLISHPLAAHPWMFESTCAANASCTSITPRSRHPMPARSSAWGTAKIGACSSCQPGSTAATA